MKNFLVVILVFMQYQLQAQVNLKENFRILTHEEFVDLGKRDLTRVNMRPYIFEGSHESCGKVQDNKHKQKSFVYNQTK